MALQELSVPAVLIFIRWASASRTLYPLMPMRGAFLRAMGVLAMGACLTDVCHLGRSRAYVNPGHRCDKPPTGPSDCISVPAAPKVQEQSGPAGSEGRVQATAAHRCSVHGGACKRHDINPALLCHSPMLPSAARARAHRSELMNMMYNAAGWIRRQVWHVIPEAA